MCKNCNDPSAKHKGKVKVRFVRRGQGFTAGEGDIFRAQAGSTVLAKNGSTGVFLNGSTGTAYEGSTFTAEAGSVVHAKYGSIGRARKGSTIIANYGSHIEDEAGAKIIRRADEEEHAVAGSLVSSYAELSAMERSLVDHAWAISKTAYCRYSNFPVGAAILAENEAGEKRIFDGHNIENASYGGTVCAERVAAFDAVKNGFRKFLIVAVVCAKCPGGSPCGFCRQVLREFGLNATVLNIFNTESTVVRWTVDQLLPDSFGPDSL
jgi:cytidine deaminase